MLHPWTAAQVADELAHPLGLAFGAEDENGAELLGFALFRRLPPECELLRVAVHPRARRRGIAAGLLTFALAECADAGCAECFLEVRASNQAALGLYAALGFRENGRRPRYYDHPVEDALLFHRELCPITKQHTGERHEKSA